MKRLFCGITVLVLLLSGCASNGVVRKLEANGTFAATSKVAAEDIRVAKPFKPKYGEVAYLLINSEGSDVNNKFLASVIKSSGVFRKTMEVPEMERMIVEKRLADKVGSAIDLVSLNKLQKEIGFFLVVDPSMEWKGGYNFTGSIKVQDPETGDTVLHLQRNAFNWAGLDDPLTYPLVNALIQWSRGEQISTESKK